MLFCHAIYLAQIVYYKLIYRILKMSTRPLIGYLEKILPLNQEEKFTVEQTFKER